MLNRLYKGPFTLSVSGKAVMALAILFLLKTVGLLENGLQTHSGATLLFSMRAVSQVSSQR